MLAGPQNLLHLPSKFTDTMEGQDMAYAKLRECYFRDGWSKFFIDYGVHEGWFLLLTRHDGKKDFTICLFDGTLSARTFAAWS
jgi:hypothetical protein